MLEQVVVIVSFAWVVALVGDSAQVLMNGYFYLRGVTINTVIIVLQINIVIIKSLFNYTTWGEEQKDTQTQIVA